MGFYTALCLFVLSFLYAECVQSPTATQLSSVGKCRMITCSSNQSKYVKCDVKPNERIISVTMDRQESQTECIRCNNWNAEGTYVWVDGGCRARFRLCTVAPHEIECKPLTCESNNLTSKKCKIANAHAISTVSIEKQLSLTKCHRCTSYNNDKNSITVNEGCRARFNVCYRRKGLIK